MVLGSLYGPGTGEILLDDVHCVGNETSIANCTHGGWGVNNCGHGEDVSVLCDPALHGRLIFVISVIFIQLIPRFRLYRP